MLPKLNKIHQGDTLATLKTWPDEFINCVVTSPPYWGLRDYGVAGQLGLEKTPEEYVAKMTEVFREVRRVLRKDGTLWLNIGDSYAGSGKGTYADGTSHGTDGKKQKTNVGSIGVKMGTKEGDAGHTHAVKPPPGLKPKDLVGIPWMLAFAIRADGWYLRQDIIWAKPNPMPESVTDRYTKSHEYFFLLTKSPKYFYDAEAIKEPGALSQVGRERDDVVGGNKGTETHHSPGGRYGNKKVPAGWDTGAGAHGTVHREGRSSANKQRGHIRTHDGFNGRWDDMSREEQCGGMKNKRSVWTVSPQPFAEAHFATFPEDLILPCIMAGAQVGGIVLDPFMGAGTTALVAAKLNRQFIGCEINTEYIKIAEKRIANEMAQGKMF